MIEKTIKDFILNGAYFDVLDYKKVMKAPVVENYEENQWSYIVEIMILTIKSLKPSQKYDGNIIDYKRFKLELELWKSYRHGMNKNILYSIDGRLDYNYFNSIDESIYSRIAIITLANQNWKTVKSEVIKNILFTSGSIDLILECMLLARILFSISRNKAFKYEEVLEELKYEAINFSQVELLDYENYYRVPRSKYEKNYTIEFERTRINIISLLNGINLGDKFSTLKTCLDILEGKLEYNFEMCDNFFSSGLFAVVTGEVESNKIKDVKFLESLCSYIVKLRKGRIETGTLDITGSTMPYIFDYKQDDVFIHPLLNQSKIIYKGQRESFEIAYVKTRTGIYRFVELNKN